MREILFRGKRIDNGEWVYGSLVTVGVCTIIPRDAEQWDSTEYNMAFAVIPGTVGQYTAMRDRNGELIFEGDVIQCMDARGFICFGAYASAYSSGKTHVGFYIEWIVDRMLRIDVGFWADKREVEVIGNIHDNPELLEVAK